MVYGRLLIYYAYLVDGQVVIQIVHHFYTIQIEKGATDTSGCITIDNETSKGIYDYHNIECANQHSLKVDLK